MEILLPFQQTSTNFQTHEHYCQWQTKMRAHICDLLPSLQRSTNPLSGQYGKKMHIAKSTSICRKCCQIWALRQWLHFVSTMTSFWPCILPLHCTNMANSSVVVEALEYIHHHPQHSPGNGCACYVAPAETEGPINHTILLRRILRSPSLSLRLPDDKLAGQEASRPYSTCNHL